MNENSSSNPTRWYCQKLPTVSSFTGSNVASRKRKKAEEKQQQQQEDQTNAAIRVVANPNITKTQIAKISYVAPVLLTSPLTETGTSSSVQKAQINFVQKRKERDVVIKEFKSMLNQLNTRSTPPEAWLQGTTAANATATAMEPMTTQTDTTNNTNLNSSIEYIATVVTSRGTMTAPNSFRRAQTELIVERPKSLTARTKSFNQIDIARSGTAHTASTTNRMLDSANRKCAYDPTAARRYMKAQQKRRRSSCLKPGQEDAIKKEEIKKRLEELKKQSRLIVTKNIKKQKFQTPNRKVPNSGHKISSTPHSRRSLMLLPPPVSASAQRNVAIQEFAGQVPGSTERSGTVDSVQIKSHLDCEILTVDLQADHKCIKSVRTVQSEVSRPVSEVISVEKTSRSAEMARDVACNRRVGILRKPESRDHSFSHIADFSFEKENVAIEMLTPQIPPPNFELKESRAFNESSGKPSTASNSIKTKHHSDYKEHENKSTQVQSNASLIGLTHCNTTKREAKIQTDIATVADGGDDLPYWLRPSAVQVYPYNFIHAVRRKLLSITEPAATADIIDDVPPAKNEATSTRDLNMANNNVKTHTKSETADQSKSKTHSPVVEHSDDSKNLKNGDGNVHILQTISDFNSNLSSISLQAPISNTVSEVSSLKSESAPPFQSRTISTSKATSSYQDKDDTTASSSVFSSPEKRKSHIKNINSDSIALHSHRPVSPLSLEHVEKLKIKTKVIAKSNESGTADSNKSLDFNKLLSDFNHGLSQVIEANEQLKSTLDKSQLLLSPKASTKIQLNGHSTHTEAYSTDFEDPTHATTSSSLGRQHEKPHKRKIFKSTKPLSISPTKVESNVAAVSTPDLHLDLNSVTPSSVHSSELLLNTTTTVGDDSSVPEFKKINKSPLYSPHTHEERLATIDQLKENLRRMIKESQENRKTLDKDNSCSPSSNIKSNVEKNYKLKNENLNEHTSKFSSVERHKQTATTTKKSTTENSPHRSTYSETENTATSEDLHNSSRLTLLNTYDITTDKHSTTIDKTHSSHCSKSTYKIKYNKSNDDTNSSNHTITEKIQSNSQESSYKNNNGNNVGENSQRLNLNGRSRIEQNINKTRRTFEAESFVNALSSPPPPGYTSGRRIESSPPSVNTIATTASIRTACSSEIVTLLKVADLDLSHMSSCDVSLSESSSFNYSNVGLYEKLIKSEITKSEHLASLLKMREKALLDRTKGQVAWLQVQKERCKSKGLLVHIAEIRKKQRAILLKMSKEREEIKRLLQSALSTPTPSDPTTSTRLRGGESAHQRGQLQKSNHQQHPLTLLPLTPRTTSVESKRCRPRDRKRESNAGRHSSSAAPTLLRATHELESSASVEALLRQREEDLRRRREYCERLLEWHRKLDEEELEVYNLERQLFNHKSLNGDEDVLATNEKTSNSSKATEQVVKNSTTINSSTSTLKTATIASAAVAGNSPKKRANEMERRLKEIDKSLRELNNISATTNFDSTSLSNGQRETAEANLDFVRTTGSKLNKLWRRLTSQQLEKYEPNRRYKLCKSDLERLYEEAKLAVLTDFSNVEERSLLLEKSGDGSDFNEPSSIGSARDLINAINAESTMNGNLSNDNINCEPPPPPVPSLNLNFSTSQSAEELENSENQKTASETFSISKHTTDSENQKTASETFSISKHTTGDYSPSVAERDFQDEIPTTITSSSTTTTTVSSASTTTVTSTPSNNDVVLSNAKSRSELIKRNLQKFLKNTTKTTNNTNEHALERSLSDTEIDTKTPAQNSFAAKSSNATWSCNKREFVEMTFISPEQPPNSATSIQNSVDTLHSVRSLDAYSNNVASPTTAASIAVECLNIPSSSSASSLSEWRSCRYYDEEICSAKSCSIITASQETRPTVIKSIGNTASLSETTTTSQSNANTIPNNNNIQENADHSKTISSSIIEPQQITNEFDTKSNEIAAKLNEISEAVARLSQTNSLASLATLNEPTFSHSNSNSTNPKQDQKIEIDNETQTQNTNSLLNDSNISSSNNSQEFSYSTTFESSTKCTTPDSKQKLPKIANDDNQSIGATMKTNSCMDVDEIPYQNPSDQSALRNSAIDCFDLQETADETLLSEVSMPLCFDTTFDTTGTTLNLEDIDDVETSKYTPSIEAQEISPAKMSTQQASNHPTATKPQQTTNSSSAIILPIDNQQQQLMPDIINELEIRRCQKILLENEQLRQYEQVPAVPYVFVREIPNKPPPPYCPPAHGSPMTTIFPSEERIKDITFRRTHELYCEVLKTDHVNEKGEKLPSVLDEKITNIYERIVLDICREYLDEHSEVLNPQSDPTNFHSQLAFFNPPNRLRCIQESIYKDVRRCLGMDKTSSPRRTPVYSIYGQRAKRDHIGQIIIQEMYEEDEKWCSFFHEEDEVLDLIIDEMIGHEVCNIAKDVLVEEGIVVLEARETLDTNSSNESQVFLNGVEDEKTNIDEITPTTTENSYNNINCSQTLES